MPRERAEDLVSAVFVAAGASVFRGKELGEFIGWLRSITRNLISSDYRRRESRPQTCPLDGPATTAEVARGADGDFTSLVALADDLGAELGKLRPDHQRVIEMMLLEGGYSADEAAGAIDGMTAANAYKIVSRFRRRLKVAL